VPEAIVFRHPLQPGREHFCSVLARHGAGKTQSALAQDALIRISAQEAFHQHREPGTFRFFPYCHRQRVVDLRQQRTALAVGQEAVVAHHFKMPRRNMADVPMEHLLLTDFLAFVLLRAVIVILMDHGAAVGLFGKMHFPGAAILGMQITVPPFFITDMTEARQGAGVDLRVVVAQQVNDGVAPDGLHLFLFKKQLPPGAVFDVEAAAGDGHVDMRMLIQLPAIDVQRAKYADFDTLLARPAEHGAGGAAKQVIEQGPVVVEEWPQQVGHVKRNVLPIAVGKDVLLFGDPLLGGLEATAAAGFGLAGLTEKAGMGTVR